VSDLYQVRYDPVALAALEEAAAYIEEQSGPDRAASWLRAMRAGIEKLETFPRAFPAMCVRRGRTIHSKLVISHRVYYFIDEPTRLVYVIDVVHTARETKLAGYRDPPG
jgi:plasmid stabilization system protein ParE